MKTMILLFALFALPGVRAADQPAATKAVPAASRASSFTPEGSGRNPFWPIGWKPALRAQSLGEQSASPVPASAFLVSTITMDQGARFAIINGRAMQEGQQFGLQMGSQTYQITVKTIEDGRVILTRRGEEIIAPLHRK